MHFAFREALDNPPFFQLQVPRSMGSRNTHPLLCRHTRRHHPLGAKNALSHTSVASGLCVVCTVYRLMTQ